VGAEIARSNNVPLQMAILAIQKWLKKINSTLFTFFNDEMESLCN
jgi:hypothetical protein